jgi:Holliday junction resolvase RusA-like endonuclease
MEFEIPFRLPGLNEYIRVCRENKFKASGWKRNVESSIFPFLKGKVTEPSHVTFVWKEPTRKRDKDNVAFAKKFILDALQKKGVLPNDNNRWITGFTDEFVYGEGEGVIVTLEPDQIIGD